MSATSEVLRTSAGEVFGHRFTVRIPATEGRGSKSMLTELSSGDSERIAIALSSVLQEADRRAGRPPRNSLYSDWVEISKEREAGTYTITVVNRDVMAMVRPYVDPVGPVAFTKPMLAGYRLDMRKHYLNLNQHGQLIGMSTGGKSSLIQCMIAYATLCAERNQDVVIWVAGEHKLYDLVMGWVEPLLDSGRRCPIDWVVKGYDDSMQMLAAVRRVAQSRQSARLGARGNWPAIFLILDEVSSLVEHHKKPIMFDGAWMHADMMVADIVRFDTQGDVFAVLATQHDVHAVLGDKGNTLQAQLKYSAMFQIQDDSTHGRQLGDYKLKMPRFPGEYWIRDMETGMPVRLKAPYPQSSDPRKEVLHDGLTVADIALRRSIPEHYGLDSASAEMAGPAYANRHRTVTDEFIDYLRGVSGPIVVQNGNGSDTQSAPAPAPIDDDSELRDAEADLARNLRILVDMGDDIGEEMAAFLDRWESDPANTTPRETTAPAAEVSSMMGRQSRKDRVKVIIREHGPLARAEIVGKLHHQGDTRATGQSVTNILTELVATGEYQRDTDSRYRAL